MLKSKLVLGAGCLITLLAATGPLSAATLTWSAAATNSGDTDVSLTGTLDRAFNFGGPGVENTTINGVTFVAAAYNNSLSQFPIMPNTALSVDALNGGSNDYGSSAAPYNGLSGEYKLLLSTAIFAFPDAPLTLTLSNLTAGLEYRIQMWTNDSTANGHNRNTTFIGSTNVTAEQNSVQNDDGGLGQYVIGTFIADSTSQAIQLQGIGGSPPRTVLNAFQLRAIPEPGVIPVVGLMGLWFAAIARRRRN